MRARGVYLMTKKEKKPPTVEVGTYNTETGESILGVLPPKEILARNIERMYQAFGYKATVTLNEDQNPAI